MYFDDPEPRLFLPNLPTRSNLLIPLENSLRVYYLCPAVNTALQPHKRQTPKNNLSVE